MCGQGRATDLDLVSVIGQSAEVLCSALAQKLYQYYSLHKGLLATLHP